MITKTFTKLKKSVVLTLMLFCCLSLAVQAQTTESTAVVENSTSTSVPASKSNKTLKLALMAGGGAVLVGGGVMNILAYTYTSTVNDNAKAYENSTGSATAIKELWNTYVYSRDSLRTRYTVSIVLYGIGAAAVAAGFFIPLEKKVAIVPLPLKDGASLQMSMKF